MDREIPKEVKRRERRRVIVRYSVTGGLIIIGLLMLMRLMEGRIFMKDMKTGVADRGVIEVTISASGKVVPLIEEIIVSPINSRILKVYKKPGDILRKGDAILKLDLSATETEYKKRLDEREMKVSRMLQSKISFENTLSEMKMQRKVKEMQSKLMEIQLQNERYLDSIGASTADRVRQYELDYEVNLLELSQLYQKIENLKKSTEADRRIEELELSVLDKSLEQTYRLLTDANILAPQEATLTFVNSEIGSRVSEGTKIAVISDLNRFKIEAEIVSSYAEMLAVGARTLIRISDLELEGTVVNITPSVKNGMVDFTVMLAHSEDSRLRSGLKTDVYVFHGIHDDVIRIPNGKFYSGRGEYELWIVKGERAEKRTVRLGDSNYDYIEVINGIDSGEQLILADMSSYKHKQSLKIKY